MTARALALLCVTLACRREPEPHRPTDVPTATERPAPQRVLSRDRASLRDVLSPASRRALDESTVTLLVPDDPVLVATAVVTSGRQWAAISITRGDHTITVHAAREGGADAGAREDRVRGRPASVTTSDGVRAATWEERGVTYALGLACARADDPRCARDRHLREIANALVPLEGPRAP